MSYNISLWSIVLLMYMSETPTCVVRGQPISSVPGMNVSLPCMAVNDQKTIKWWGHNGYISSGKDFLEIFNTLKEYCAIGTGNDYSLFIMIPDDKNIWPYLAETYECRLVPGNDEDVTTIESYELQIYQPECTIYHINSSIAVASCSYQNIPEFQVKLLIDNSDNPEMNHCTSDTCTLNYTYSPSEVIAQDLVCSVTISEKELSRTICSMQNYITKLPQETTEESLTSASSPISSSPTSTSPTLNLATENSLTSSTKSTTNKSAFPLKTIIINTKTTPTIMISTVTTNIQNTSTIMTTTVLERIAISSTTSTTTGGIAIYLIVILSGAAVIIMFLIILLYFVRRSFKVKQNSSRKSQSADKNVYLENDEKKNTQKISMMERHTAQKHNINFEQSSVDSEMEDNCIYQSADTNADEQNRNIEGDNVAMRLSRKANTGQTDKAYVEINEIIDKKSRNKKSDRLTTLQTQNKVETSDDLGYIENENEAYQSLDEVNERTRNAGIIQEGSGGTQATEQNDVHYDVLERDA
ncbi:uncharacterized protein LOC117112842 [Anneissia japonica]|uniref:uncharacterized protein LOC117112842 n=1 Tax=Anneissia japonica TaxID=1529436 RepID=UPI001425B003|nr:uncharacterized protein LOC117112842 [Anneissia japonica]XP_033111925.1 uncharacterized protein LOC117112842 [Anneissia japonica]